MKNLTLILTIHYVLFFQCQWALAQGPGTWTQKKNFGGGPVSDAAAFSIGGKGYIGQGQNFWVYDPDNNSWTKKANFGGVQLGACGFAIDNQGYFVGGGTNAQPTDEVWQYDVTTNSWTQKAPVATPRENPVGFSIGAKGYVGTGYGGGYKDDFWEYEPNSNVWTQKANFGGGARYEAVGFSIGNKGYIGTGILSVDYKNDFWEYDPDSNTWTQKANFGGVPRGNAIGFSIGNKGYIGTGINAAGTYYKDFWEYDPANDIWIQNADFAGGARYKAVGFSIGNKGYIGTGYYYDGSGHYYKDFWEFNPCDSGYIVYADADGDGYGNPDSSTVNPICDLLTGFSYNNLDINDANGLVYPGAPEVFDCLDNNGNGLVDEGKWTQKASFSGTARYDATGFSINGKVYIGTGSKNANTKKEFWQYDPLTDLWTQMANFAGGQTTEATGFAMNSKGYIGTGLHEGGALEKSFYEYDPITNTWIPKAEFGGLERREAVGFSIDGKGYIGTGYSINLSNPYYKDFWQYNPGNNVWTQKADFGGSARGGAVGFSIGNKGYLGTGDVGSQNGSKDFWEYDPDANTWTQKEDFGGTERYDAVGFCIGNIGYIGTGSAIDGYKKDFWQYDPVNNSWKQDVDFSGIPRMMAVGIGTTGKGFIATGIIPSQEYNDVWEYNPAITFDTAYADADGDGFGDMNNAIPISGCNIPDNYVFTGTDCNDANAAIHPGACDGSNGIDDNCDGETDNGTGATAYYTDQDEDSYGGGSLTYFCINPGSGYSENGDDCNDTDASIYPGACDGSNGIDDNCDGETDNGTGAIAYYTDQDEDSYGGGSLTYFCINPGSGYSENGDDCNDTDASIHPGVCDGTNGIDDNCDGLVDNGAGATIYYSDADADGYGAEPGIYFCTNPGAGYSTDNTDCNDASNLIYPDAAEVNNCIDDNCDGTVDEGSVNIWTQKADFGGTTRNGAIGFSIGDKGYIGLGNSNSGYKNDFWEYDPSTNAWTQKANFGGTARYLAVGFSIGSKGYIGTGDDGTYTKDFWEYDPVVNTWTKKTNFGGSARYWATGFSIGNKGYIGLGNNSSGYKNDFWEYDPATNTWLQKANFGGTARGAATGFGINDKGYIGTGYDGSFKNDFWEYNPATNLWTQKSNFGGTAIYEAVGFSFGSKGYIGTGSSGTLKNTFWEYNPASNVWTQKSSFSGTARYNAVGFAIGSKGYIGTGSDGSNKNDFWEFTTESTVCPLPLSIIITNITATKATVSWTGNNCAYSYRIRKRPIGTETWIYSSVTAPATTKVLSGNLCTTDYEVQVQTYCNSEKTDSSGYTASVNFHSLCPLPESVTITDVTDTKATVNWDGSDCAYSYRIRKRPVGTETWIYSSVTAPTTIKTLSNNLASTTYEVQVQTYCDSLKTDSSGYTASVNFTSASGCAGVTTASTTNITSTSATLNWTYSVAPSKWTIKHRPSNTSNWTTVKINGSLSSYVLNGLSANTDYDWKIRAKCDSEHSDWSKVQHFTTALKLASEVNYEIPFTIYPNPAQDRATIQFTLIKSSHVNIKVFDLSGKEMILLTDNKLEAGEYSLELNTTHFAKGVYVVRMISDEGMVNHKLVVQ